MNKNKIATLKYKHKKFNFFVIYNAWISKIYFNNIEYYITFWRFENYNRFWLEKNYKTYYDICENDDFYKKERILYN